jgi:hypothetical protein
MQCCDEIESVLQWMVYPAGNKSQISEHKSLRLFRTLRTYINRANVCHIVPRSQKLINSRHFQTTIEIFHE